MPLAGSDALQGHRPRVECPLREATRYKGTVLDETGQPLPYANVALLSPRDSTVITGGVTNESGLFVIPCDQSGVLARITYVGYRPVYRHCKTPHLGTIKMQPDQYTLGSVTVKGPSNLSAPPIVASSPTCRAQFWNNSDL